MPQPTLSELFAAHPRDGGWAGFLLAQLDTDKPLLWVQERMAILESGRIHPPGLPAKPHPRRGARRPRRAVGDGGGAKMRRAVGRDRRIVGRPARARLHRDAAARGRVGASGAPCWLVRLGGTANLSGARMRWRIGSAPSLANPLDPRAPGLPAWDAELFRARGMPPGRWSVAHEADRFHLVAAPGDRTLGEGAATYRLTAPVVLTVEGTHGPIIHAVTKAAAERGARPGARLTDARALDPALVAVPADPAGDAALLQRLARWAGRWSPLVEVDGADGAAGSTSAESRICSAARTGWCADIEQRFARIGLTARDRDRPDRGGGLGAGALSAPLPSRERGEPRSCGG